MTFTAEVVVRLTGESSRLTLAHDGNPPATWTERDAADVLRTMLLAIDQAVNAGENAARGVSFRGISWIVTPFDDGVAIAIEIPSGAAVAGPFDIPEERLTALLTTVMHRAVH
jgi:hypothetical protein